MMHIVPSSVVEDEEEKNDTREEGFPFLPSVV